MKIFEARRPGNQTYTKAQLLTILNTTVGSGNSADASLILADQLIAARLSIANGSDPAPINATIAAADARLATFSGRLPYKVKPSSAIGQQMTALAALLDQYNKGPIDPWVHAVAKRRWSCNRAWSRDHTRTAQPREVESDEKALSISTNCSSS